MKCFLIGFIVLFLLWCFAEDLLKKRTLNRTCPKPYVNVTFKAPQFGNIIPCKNQAVWTSHMLYLPCIYNVLKYRGTVPEKTCEGGLPLTQLKNVHFTPVRRH